VGVKLSVVVPVYNGEHYVSRCIDSLQNQSLKEIQIIVVDDGSTDQTAEVVRQYMKHTTNVQLVQRSKNEGTGSARNLGIEHAMGEYIAFLDVDDWMDMNGYLEMTTALDTSASDIGICNICTEYGDYLQSEIRYQYRHSNTITGSFAFPLIRSRSPFLSN